MPHFILAVEIVGIVLAALWGSAFLTAGIRRLLNGPDVPEPIDAAFIAKYTKQAAGEWWPHRLLVVFDIFVNVCCRGQQDETISARSYRAYLEGKLWGRVMNYWLNLFQYAHGPKAAVGDLWRAQARVETNKKILGIQ
jgi:hypothetical protein